MMLPALGFLTSAQSKGTQVNTNALTQLLNYAATHPDATLWFMAIDMVLHIYSNVSYMSEEKVLSQAGGHSFLSITPTRPGKAPVLHDPPPPP